MSFVGVGFGAFFGGGRTVCFTAISHSS
jgi:hypothetical protein